MGNSNETVTNPYVYVRNGTITQTETDNYVKIVYKNNRKDGNSCNITLFFPKDENGNIITDGTFYYPGVGGYKDSGLDGTLTGYYDGGVAIDFETQTLPSTAFMAFQPGTRKTFSGEVDAIYEYIFEQTGIELVPSDVSGHSLGGIPAFNRFTEYLENGKAPDNLSLTLYDPSPKKDDWKGQQQNLTTPDKKITDENGNTVYQEYNPELLDQMQENGSSVRLFLRNSDNFRNSAFLNSAARRGIPVIKIINPNISHPDIVKKATQDGWQLFLEGKIELKDIKDRIPIGKKVGYTIEVPLVDDNNNVTWKSYSLNELQEKYSKYYSLSEEEQQEYIKVMRYIEGSRVKADYNFIDDINAIYTAAGNLIDLCEEDSTITYTSSSQLLPLENEFIKSVRNKSTGILTDVESTSALVAGTKIEYQKTEEDLDNMSEDL